MILDSQYLHAGAESLWPNPQIQLVVHENLQPKPISGRAAGPDILQHPRAPRVLSRAIAFTEKPGVSF